jgi:hypothetical protein
MRGRKQYISVEYPACPILVRCIIRLTNLYYMSFRHTVITEFLYKANSHGELNKLETLLNDYGNFKWQGNDNLGYFHGIIKDLNGIDTKEQENEIVEHILKETGVRIKIVIE